MKTVKNLKKVVAMMLAVATLVTGMTFTSETKAQAFWYDKPVQFMGMDDCWATAYIHVENPYGVYHYKLYLQVENSAYNKNITMWYSDRSHHTDGNYTQNGEWHNSEKATFVKKLENNRELWVIEGYVNGNAQFCLHYTTDNGVDAWDNNDGKDYRFYDVAEYDNREIKELLK
ncbi:MAG: hypothetical protein IIT48_10590 [Lachnospiraceae bacterium]|nr:hypothetical protein [Lachnospiraceae bacterium]